MLGCSCCRHRRWSLQDAVNIALKNSLDLQLLAQQCDIANTNNFIGVAGGCPVVTANVSDNEQVTSVHQKLKHRYRDQPGCKAAGNISPQT